MHIANTPKKLHAELDKARAYRGRSRCVSLVTTRGDLHAGHGAVINAAKTVSDVVVVAIIPNHHNQPDNIVTANEFHDIGFVEQHHADLLYAPTETVLFPNGARTLPTLQSETRGADYDVDAQALILHLKIINAVQPDICVWGEKQFLEYSAVKQLVADLDIRTQMQCIPTVRHANGVAVSAMDKIYPADDAQRVALVSQTLDNAAHAIRGGARNFDKVENTARVALKGAGFEIDYLRILDEHTLHGATLDSTSYRIVIEATLNGMPVEDNLGLSL